MGGTYKSALKYAALPGIIPRFIALFRNSFSYIAFLIAQVFFMARLLEPTHPYLDSGNIGLFGVRHVIGEAANKLVLSRNNIDQILIFVMILTGLVLIALQIILFILSLVINPDLAFAAENAFPSTSNPVEMFLFFLRRLYEQDLHAQDISYILLDKIFGVKGIFNSCVSTDIQCRDIFDNVIEVEGVFPTAFHLGLHKLLAFYSAGIFMVAVIVIIYYIIAIVAETAATGIPFGKRFNKAWLLPRLIIFTALLIPAGMGPPQLSSAATEEEKTAHEETMKDMSWLKGINAAQYITLLVAREGSAFATSGWRLFVNHVKSGPLDSSKKLYAAPGTPPEFTTLAQFIYTAAACEKAENHLLWAKMPVEKQVQPFFILPEKSLTETRMAIPLDEVDYEKALRESNYGPISIVLGRQDEEEYPYYRGHVMPRCGELIIGATDMSDDIGSNLSGFNPSAKIHKKYFEIVQEQFSKGNLFSNAECTLIHYSEEIKKLYAESSIGIPTTCGSSFDVAQTISNYNSTLNNKINSEIKAVLDNLNNSNEWNLQAQLIKKGWAGAALWYNKLAELNGKVTSAVFNVPVPQKYPFLMEKVALFKSLVNPNVPIDHRFDPLTGQGQKNKALDTPEKFVVANALNKVYSLWAKGELTETPNARRTDNLFHTLISTIFGTKGLFDMRENKNVHPLAQLSSMGKGIMDATVRNIFGGIGANLLSKLFGESGGGLLQTAGGFFSKIGMTFLAMGFVLYYVLPFLPFIYFFFAVSSWVSSIFEAIVAVPLWALAHLRVDGNGLPGKDAAQGYFLLLEIYLRPILILFGLLSSIILFSAMVDILNDIFDLVTHNMMGFDYLKDVKNLTPDDMKFYKAPIDQFFLSVVYACVVYLLGTSCFKMIDLIPNQILRFAGAKTKTFSEFTPSKAGPAQTVMSNTYRGGKILTGNLQGGQIALLMN